MATPCSCGRPDCIDCLIQSVAPPEDQYPPWAHVPIESLTLVIQPLRGAKQANEKETEQATLATVRGLLHEIAVLCRIAGLESTVHARRKR